ncbi:glycosyltransferase family 9 protein [Cochleicola gelatinilyticus]|uniref:ADP-heptose--LPS heptosyltransferase n=1 Tax=Cochleicola gelatinilyticus TaxID=1763537 RepID=A0A167HD54_9FLAO|nr:glycosyltransferase family 9 protein [Cochleicola gelatinilyticus]OAB78494.1 ADP-heptose--LPS heptosyltransferase [Cochleicola gelatinilyticus]
MKKILVIQNKRIGDVLLSSVIANNIKTVFPDSEVHFFAYDYTTGVLENNPNIDHIIRVKEKELKKINILIETIDGIRRAGYDIIFDPYAKFQSRMMCLFSKAEYRIGFKRAEKKLRLPFYTHPINFKKKATLICGRAIEDRIHLVESVFELPTPDTVPKIFLTSEEQNSAVLNGIEKPVIMLGVLGSTPQKSMPYEYIAELINYITATYRATLLFNYAPHQKTEAQKIYELCDDKAQINLDVYADSIRDFAVLMNQCDLLVSNEGGSVHITKALDKPTFTIYSPYIDKDAWNSFEDGKFHESIHLLEEQPDLYTSFSREETKKIEENPELLYRKLTPELILGKLIPFLQHHLKGFEK